MPKLANDIKELVPKKCPKFPENENNGSDKESSSESEEVKNEAMDYFKSILFDLLPDIIMSENERIVDRYNNKMNPFNKKASLGGRLQNQPPCKLKEIIQHLGI